MRWTDKNIDKLYRKRAEDLSFEYDKVHWDEFEAMHLGAENEAKESSLTDTQIDAMYSASAADLSFYYSSQYWNEFSQSFETSDGFQSEDAGVLNDHVVDNMYKEGTSRLSFDYNTFYWDEFLSLWRRHRRPDMLWFATAYAFIGAIGLLFFTNTFDDVKSQSYTAELKNSQITPSEEVEASIDKIETSINSRTPVSFGPTLRSNTTGNIVLESDLETISLETPTTTQTVQSISTPINNLTLATSESKIEELVQSISDEFLEDDHTILTLRELISSSNEIEYKNPHVPFEVIHVNYFVQADGGLSQPILEPSDHFATSAGLGVGVELNKGRFSMVLAATGRVENYEDLTLTRSAKIYGFGSEVHQFSVDLKQLYSVEGHFGIGYNLNRHRMELGLRPSFVLTSKITVSSTRTATDLNSGIESSSVEKRDQYGYMNGVNRLRLKPTIGYTLKVTPTLSIGATAGIDFRPSIDKDNFDKTTKGSPIEGEIYLRKTITLKR
ncbi:hypothetical protein OAU25_03210 [Crocinitomicaceae bacterium]|nr:hypothetical protein [Crocinitomicaceae bacterium]